jgi:alanine racemase
VIKANAYGHGLTQLREAGIRSRLVILGGCLTAQGLGAASDLARDVVVHSPEQAALLAATVLGAPVTG